MKKKYIVGTLFLLFTILLTGCCMSHEWTEATCTMPKTCSKCGETEGDVTEHIWTEATCTAPKTCSLCGETEGDALSHAWIEATCSAPKTCSLCGETEGEALAHTLSEANYQQPATCSVCGTIEGKPLEADYEKYSISYMTEVDKEYAFPCKCYSTDDITNGKVIFSDYKIFEGDDTYEAMEGYEWRTIICSVIFDDENAFNYGFAGYSRTMGDYYDTENFSQSDTLYYNGKAYEECIASHETLEEGWVENADGTAYSLARYLYAFRVPVGYDGMTISVINEETRNKITGSVVTIEDALVFLESEGTVTFRLK